MAGEKDGAEVVVDPGQTGKNNEAAEQLKDAIEVELSVDELREEQERRGEDGERQQEERPERPRNKVTAKKRIDSLTYEKHRLAEQVAELQRENLKLAQQRDAADRAAFANYERATRAALQDAKDKLRKAEEEGDFDAKTAALEEVAALAPELRQIEDWKARQPKQQAQVQQRQQPQQQAQQGRISENAQAWLSENSWFQKGSADFDPVMAQMAYAYGEKLTREWTKEGRGGDVDSPEYWDAITEFVQNQFPERFDGGGEDDEEEQPVRRPPARVAPVVRSPGTGGGNQRGPQRVSLSVAEQEMARALNLKHPNGKTYSPEESYRAYAMQKLKIQANSRNRGAR